jgi:hypothetical protein
MDCREQVHSILRGTTTAINSLELFPRASGQQQHGTRAVRKQVDEQTRSSNSGTASRYIFGSILHGIIDLCFPSSSTPLVIALLDFQYLQFGLCRLDTTRPFLILLFPVDRLHGA